MRDTSPKVPSCIISLVQIRSSGNKQTNKTTGAKEGHGQMRYASGDIYTGEWRSNVQNGKGKFVWTKAKGYYDGDWYKGMRVGIPSN